MPAQEHAAPNFQRTPGVSLSPSLKEVLARNANLAAQVGASILLRRARASRQRLLRGHGGADPRPARLDSEIGQVEHCRLLSRTARRTSGRCGRDRDARVPRGGFGSPHQGRRWNREPAASPPRRSGSSRAGSSPHLSRQPSVCS